jgi:hypothetical protein
MVEHQNQQLEQSQNDENDGQPTHLNELGT